MEHPYVYEPLRIKDSIRLLKLVSKNANDQLEVSLTAYSLSDSALSFNALSYTWGGPLSEEHPHHTTYDNKAHHVVCEGSRIRVTENLMDALRQLLQYEQLANSPIWNDAICINQADTDERTQQIKLMAAIYSKAAMVIIWLRKSDPTSDRAIRLAEIGSEHHHGSMTRLKPDEARCAALTGTDSNSVTEDLKVINNFMQRKWFRRLWTLQEVLLPKNTMSMCGSRVFHIDIFTVLAAVLLRSDKSLITSGSGDAAMSSLSNEQLLPISSIVGWIGCTWRGGGFGERAWFRYPNVDRERTIPGNLKWLMALEPLINETRQRECAQQKDKILAPLAFAMKFATQTEEAHKQAIENILDYSSSTEELYCRFTRFMIDSMNNLDILSRTDRQNDKERLNLPSWVPSFHSAGVSSFIDDILTYQFDAAGHLGAFESSRYSWDKLRVEAIFLGAVVAVSRYTAKSCMITTWLDMALYETEFSGGSTDSGSPQSMVMDIAHICAQLSVTEEKRRQEHMVPKIRNDSLHSQCSTPAIVRLNAPSVEKPGRRLFSSTLGMVGLGPEATMEGDKVCIFRGARVPFIVRRHSGQDLFELIGEAYLDGQMHGRLADDFRNTQPIILV